MAIEFTDFDVWAFKRDEEGKWLWQRTSPDGEVLIAAANAFSSMENASKTPGAEAPRQFRSRT